MEVGSIYFCEEFKFSDGTTGEKIFIVVNAPSNKENYLVCKTTSKEKPTYRIRKQGCSAPEKNYFLFFAENDWFKKDTWIQFDELYEFETGNLLKGKFENKIHYKANLKENNTRAILNCILKSYDISEIYLKSIRKTLKKLREDSKNSKKN